MLKKIHFAIAKCIFDDLIENKTRLAVISPVTLAECLVAPMRNGIVQRQQNFIDFLNDENKISLEIIDEETGQEAANFRAKYNPMPFVLRALTLRSLRQLTKNNIPTSYVIVGADLRVSPIVNRIAKMGILLFGSCLNKGKTMNKKVSIVIEKDENGYYAYCPELPGCQSQGDTFEEINANIKEAVKLYLETLSLEEVEPYLSQEIYTTAMEVSFA